MTPRVSYAPRGVIPIQPRPAAGRPERTSRMRGSPSASAIAPPPVAAITPASGPSLAMVCSNSTGADGPSPITALWSSFVSR